MGSFGPIVAVVAAVLAIIGRARFELDRRARHAEAAARTRLASPDPALRCAAIRELCVRGLPRYAGDLVELTRTEREPQVIDELRTAIGRHRREATDPDDVHELHRWSSQLELARWGVPWGAPPPT